MPPHRILFLLYYFPPIKSIAVNRNFNLVKHFSSFFTDSFVFTTRNNRFLPQEPRDTEGVETTEITTFDYRTLTHWLKPNRTEVHHTEQVKEHPLVRFGIRLLDSFPFNLLFHEGGILYSLICVYKGYFLIKKHKITHIYSSFRPYSDHFTAYLLTFFFPEIIWIADFRDLHIDPLYQMPLIQPVQHWFNRQILKRAKCVTTVSQGLAAYLTRYNKNVFVLRNGVDILPVASFAKTGIARTKFTIGYTGSMFLDERSPKLLLEVVRELVDMQILTKENFEILYAGKDTAIWLNWIKKYDLAAFFTSKGMVSSTEAKEIQYSVHINLLLTSALPNYGGVMTGKFYEYLAAKQPIVVLINGTQDIEFEQIMSDLNAGRVVYNDKSHDILRGFVLEKFTAFKENGFVNQTIYVEKLKELEWAFTVEKLMQKIKGLK
jgi:hypothetical protein